MFQQKQTFDFFKSYAKQWQISAEDSIFSTIQNRHLAVLETLKKFEKDSSILDIGCGTGQLAIEASSMGWDATGVDFAEEMIEIALNNNKKSETNTKFITESIFEYDTKGKNYDVISAQGFIEYISLEQLDEFFGLLRGLLKDSGMIAIGSRNRLFNLVSFNKFTELENALGTTDKIINESVILQTSSSQKDAIAKLRKLNAEYTQPTKHPETGIKVDVRHQFTPADLITRIEKYGFKVTAIYPVHFHALPVQLMNETEIKTFHKNIARHISECFITSQNFVPYSSSYVMEAGI